MYCTFAQQSAQFTTLVKKSADQSNAGTIQSTILGFRPIIHSPSLTINMTVVYCLLVARRALMHTSRYIFQYRANVLLALSRRYEWGLWTTCTYYIPARIRMSNAVVMAAVPTNILCIFFWTFPSGGTRRGGRTKPRATPSCRAIKKKRK